MVKRQERDPILRLSRGKPSDLAPHPDEEGVLEGSGEPQDRSPRMRHDLPDSVEEQEAEPLRSGGSEISG